MWTPQRKRQIPQQSSTCGIASYSLPPTFTSSSVTQFSALNRRISSVKSKVSQSAGEGFFGTFYTEVSNVFFFPQDSWSDSWWDSNMSKCLCLSQIGYLAHIHLRQSVSPEQTSHALSPALLSCSWGFLHEVPVEDLEIASLNRISHKIGLV